MHNRVERVKLIISIYKGDRSPYAGGPITPEIASEQSVRAPTAVVVEIEPQADGKCFDGSGAVLGRLHQRQRRC